MCSPTISCTCGGLTQLTDAEEKVKLGQSFMSLNETYSAIREEIILMQSLPMAKNAYSLLCEEEKQRGMTVRFIIEQLHALNIIRAIPTPQRQEFS